jgi:Tol biopolymer transport system component
MAMFSYHATRGTTQWFSSDAIDHIPLWSPDGRTMVFSSTRDGGRNLSSNLFLQAIDGSGTAERLTRSPQHQDPGSWSPDGNWIAFVAAGSRRGYDLYLFDMRTRQPVEFRVTDRDEWHPAISPDGNWIAYQSNEFGDPEVSDVHVEAFPRGGGRTQVSTGGGGQPTWSRDGTKLYFRKGSEIWSAPVRLGSTFEAGRAAAVMRVDNWWTRTSFGPPGYVPTPDGRGFFVTRGEPATPPPARLIVALGWTDELRTRVGAAATANR